MSGQPWTEVADGKTMAAQIDAHRRSVIARVVAKGYQQFLAPDVVLSDEQALADVESAGQVEDAFRRAKASPDLMAHFLREGMRL